MAWKKPRTVPSGAPPPLRQRREAARLKRLRTLAAGRGGHLFFFDPMHLVHNAVPAMCWQKKGREGTKNLPANSGRKRINILGAYSATDGRTVTLATEENCRQAMVVRFMEKLRENVGKGPVYLVMDNASYNRGKETAAAARRLGIRCIFLPPYSPNLNLVERLWKLAKAKLVKNRFFETFSTFKEHVCSFFENLESHLPDLEKTMNFRFEIIKSD